MIAAIILAAGRSSRFDPTGERHKLLAPIGGEALIRRSARAALDAPVDEVVVVVGQGGGGSPVARALTGLAVRFAVNDDPGAGMAASIRAGVTAVAPRADAVVIALGDQPEVPVEAYAAVIAAWTRTAKPIVVPSYGGARGHPALFARAVYQELLALTGDVGARDAIARSASRLHVVELPYPPPRDVDTVTDLAAMGGTSASATGGDDERV